MIKQIKKLKWVVVIALVLLLQMCMEITEVIQPSSATIGEEIDITVKVNIKPEQDVSPNLVFGVLVPKEWNIASSASANYSGAGGMVSGTMRLVTDEDLENISQLPWSEQMENKFGIGANYGEVEWVVFISDNPIAVVNGSNFSGDINLKLTVGNSNIKTQMGYVIANTENGLKEEEGKQHYDTRFTDCMEVTGGANVTVDLCGPPPANTVSVFPETYTTNDLLTITFDAAAGAAGEPTELLGAGEVYLSAIAKYSGLSMETERVDGEMKSLGNNLWSVTIWSRNYFNVPSDQEIDEISFYFKNSDGSINVKHAYTNEEFVIVPTCN